VGAEGTRAVGEGHDARDLVGDLARVGVRGRLIGELACHRPEHPAVELAVLRHPLGVGRPALAKCSVPLVNDPGTTMVVSTPKRASSAAYLTARASMAALAAKYGAR
jgi:hypothetical protein